jgi:DNA-binding GntR family transcriptional regulator
MPHPNRESALLAILHSERPGLSQQRILEEIRRAILSGDVPPGSPIPVDETAEVFGVSRIPIRETLKTLIGEGLVEHQPRAGYTVASVTVEEFREIYIVRGVLEMAALTAAVGNAEAHDDRRATEALAALDDALAAADYQAYQRDSRQFHLALVAPCRMPRLLHMIELVWNLTEPLQPMQHISDEHRDHLHTQHSSMLRAFIDRDSAALLAASRRHLDDLETVVADLPTETGLFAQ